MNTPITSSRRVLLIGATGLVGRELSALLVADPGVAHLTALVRRPLAVPTSDKVTVAVVDFDHLDPASSLFDVDQIYCAIGTTIRQAGSPEAFRRVDLEYPRRVAQLGRAHGATHFLLVSALGADATSRVFYNRVKGELENAITAMGFRACTIARPSLLAGDRAEFRPLEVLTSKLAFLVPGRWKPVHVRQVARSLVHAGQRDASGVQVLENIALRAALV